jgi:thiol-disulfide isomerase/thioredoxin
MKHKTYWALCLTLLAASWAHALTVAPYSAEALNKLQAAGAPVALHFHADWCPTCRAQDKALEVLKADTALNIAVLTVDYDKESELKKQLKVLGQSTFVIYRGKVEKRRQIGETSPDGIRTALRAAL